MGSGRRVMLAALGLAAAGAFAAVAQEAVPAGPPPSWESLIPCAQTSDPAEGFRCFQQALRAAGYAPNPAAVAANKRRSFGLQAPKLPKAHVERRKDAKPAASPRAPAVAGQPAPAAEPERADEVTVTLEQVALTAPLNRLLLVTTDGAVWQQTDNDTVAPLPRAGQTMTVTKGSIDGFFCRFDKRTKVRCRRLH